MSFLGWKKYFQAGDQSTLSTIEKKKTSIFTFNFFQDFIYPLHVDSLSSFLSFSLSSLFSFTSGPYTIEVNLWIHAHM